MTCVKDKQENLNKAIEKIKEAPRLRCFFYSGDLFIQIFFIYILQHHCTNFQRKSEQCDESVCIVVIVEIATTEMIVEVKVALKRKKINCY